MLVISAGLSLIGKHAAQFKEYLAKDHEVHDCITSLCSFNFHLIKLTLYTRHVAVVNMYNVVVYRDNINFCTRIVTVLTLMHIFYLMQYMYKNLLEWSLHNNRDTMKLALPALEAFLHEVKNQYSIK